MHHRTGSKWFIRDPQTPIWQSVSKAETLQLIFFSSVCKADIKEVHGSFDIRRLLERAFAKRNCIFLSCMYRRNAEWDSKADSEVRQPHTPDEPRTIGIQGNPMVEILLHTTARVCW